MFSEFTLTPTRTTENTVEKEKIADKHASVCRYQKQKQQITLMKSYAWKFLRLKFSQLFLSCYVRILVQGSKIHGERSHSQLCWSISDFLRALLVSFDFDFSNVLLKGTSRSAGPGCLKAG